MKIKLVSFNAHNINDATNYNAFYPNDVLLQGTARPVLVSRPERRPVYATKVLQGYTLPITIQMLGTVSTQINTLKTWFDVEDMTPRKLIIKNVDDSDKQWYVYATTKSMTDLDKTTLTVILSIADPVWYEETESTQAWAITGTGDTQNVTVGGNVNTRPRLGITPTSIGGTGFVYKKFVTIYNRTAYPLVNYPFNICLGEWDTSALTSFTTNSVDLNGGIDDAVTTIPFDGEVGSFPTSGLAKIEDEQISYTGAAAGNITGVTRGVNGTTAAAHADNVKVYHSKMQSDGDDLRVYFNGSEVDRWLDDIDTSTTRVWCNLDLQPKRELTLETAIADSGAVTTIKLTDEAPWDDFYTLQLMPNSGIVQIGTELFTYTGKVAYPGKLTGCTREAYATTAAAHAVGATVRWIQNEIWVYYGNSSLSVPSVDSDREPILNLTTPSTNTSWDYDLFRDDAGLRSGSWTPEVLMTLNTGYDPLHKTGVYTGVRELNANPATQMGMSVESLQFQGVWYGDVGYLRWYLNQPCGVTHVTAVGEKYRYTTVWSIWAKLRVWKESYGGGWTSAVDAWVTEVTPTAAQTWEATTARSAVALADTCTKLGFELYSALGATANDANHLSYTTVTLTLASATVPTGVFGAEQSNYHMNARITNNTTGEWLELDWGMLISTELMVDCEAKTVLGPMNENAAGAIKFSTIRSGWLDLQPGVNELQYDDVGTVGLTIDVYWRDRNS